MQKRIPAIKESVNMITLTKFNDKKVVINSNQIEYVEAIPESKIVMMNGKFHIVQESIEEIIEKTIEYNNKVLVYSNK